MSAAEDRPGLWSYEAIAERAKTDEAFRQGLRAAAAICRAQGQSATAPPCPSHMAAVYVERCADGEIP